MLRENKIWVATKATGEAIYLLPQKANRHGLITGVNNKEVDRTARLLAEGFSSLGIPVFITDINRDLAGLMAPGDDSESIQEMISHMGAGKNSFYFQGFPVTLWDVCGDTGIPLRATIHEMGPVFLSQMTHLNVPQSNTLKTIFQIADAANLVLVNVNDLKAIINYIRGRARQYEKAYGQIKTTDLDDIMRALVKLEVGSTALFWGETALNISDFFNVGAKGKGMINILDSNLLVWDRTLYSSILLWLLSELSEMLPDVGELSKPKMAFIIDEAHLLFKDKNRIFLEKAEHALKRLSQKGISVFFCTQKIQDIPDSVLRYLENRIQHSPYAFTPAQLKEVRSVVSLYRKNPAFDTFEALTTLISGEALFSLIGNNNQPCPVDRGYLLPPQSYLGRISDADREHCIKKNILHGKYARRYDTDSVYSILSRMEIEAAAAAESAKLAAEAEKDKEMQEVVKAKEETRRKLRMAAAEARKSAQTNGRNTPSGDALNVSSPSSGKSGKKAEKKSGKKSNKNPGKSIGKSIIETLFNNK